MYTLNFEGLSEKEIAAIKVFVPKELNAVVTAANSVGEALIQRWFGSEATPGHSRYAEFDLKRKTMSTYLNNKCTRLTYVKKQVGQYVDSCEVENGDLAQVISSAFEDHPAGSVPDFVPSGLRVFILGDTLVEQVTPRRRFHTMAHEVTHRVISTSDHWYGEQNCLDKASKNSPKCLSCAANWGWFYADVRDAVAK
ncbi:M35 family metallo-endopeptidase [Methylomonas sp. MK1]|uniref:M35 family metallo-endopeptidase n=1 Tax=Methylomonas sp. MK1 TaxID=1131552 RepID=UPI00037234EC|nr:M35 family metallo-endopeptidase [Methylomonas sp. MK1]